MKELFHELMDYLHEREKDLIELIEYSNGIEYLKYKGALGELRLITHKIQVCQLNTLEELNGPL